MSPSTSGEELSFSACFFFFERCFFLFISASSSSTSSSSSETLSSMPLESTTNLTPKYRNSSPPIICVYVLGMSEGRTSPMRVESTVMIIRARMAPPKTARRAFLMESTAAMKNVLSPISVAMIAEKDATRALKKPLSSSNLKLIPVPGCFFSLYENGFASSPGIPPAATPDPELLVEAERNLPRASSYSETLIEWSPFVSTASNSASPETEVDTTAISTQTIVRSLARTRRKEAIPMVQRPTFNPIPILL
mmetsp:Transcript_13029/g.29735  ORF Transcript_13029/g.29735 Transcript_13029/m.29735 type:complete len:251 (+) Transcript_13029:410-1162(+)